MDTVDSPVWNVDVPWKKLFLLVAAAVIVRIVRPKENNIREANLCALAHGFASVTRQFLFLTEAVFLFFRCFMHKKYGIYQHDKRINAK